jgi:hypothetical protein
VDKVEVTAGIIKVTPTATTDALATLILTPTLNTGGLPMTWSNAGSGCLTSSPILCTAAGTAAETPAAPTTPPAADPFGCENAAAEGVSCFYNWQQDRPAIMRCTKGDDGKIVAYSCQ